MEFKPNDVYQFRYNEEYTKKNPYPYHCFDGLLVVKELSGKIYLEDTYWTNWTTENTIFTPEEAQKKGSLTFLCNLDDMVDIKNHEIRYYDDVDVVYLYMHSGYRNRYLIKKGTNRSKTKMVNTVQRMIEKKEHEIKSAENQIKNLNDTLTKIENGNLDVWI